MATKHGGRTLHVYLIYFVGSSLSLPLDFRFDEHQIVEREITHNFTFKVLSISYQSFRILKGFIYFHLVYITEVCVKIHVNTSRGIVHSLKKTALSASKNL